MCVRTAMLGDGPINWKNPETGLQLLEMLRLVGSLWMLSVKTLP